MADIKKVIKSLEESFSYSSVSRTQVLTSSLVALTSEPCRMIEIYNDNGLSFKVNGGAEVTPIDPSVVVVHCTDASKVEVKGTGTVSYLVHK